MALTNEDRIATLSSYVPQSVLRHLLAEAGQPPEPHAEWSPAALLLIDISGFTPITAAAVNKGAGATEQLSRSFNAYLGQIVDLVGIHGGDIAKIIGDALIPQWLATDGDLAGAAKRAASCAIAIGQLGDYEDGDIRLSVKVGLSAGEMAQMHVGGFDGRWLFLVSGSALRQFSEIQSHLVTGDLVASAQAWPLISDRFVGQPLRDGHVRVRSTGQSLAPAATTRVQITAAHEAAVRGYIPQVLLSRLDAGQQDWLAELRRSSVVFVNVRGMNDETADALRSVDRLAKAAQRVAARYDGWPKEVTMDEKGTTLTLVFGVPPFTHEDDASRAVAAALAIESEIRDEGLASGVGIATGPTFCGPVGSDQRRDFAMLGGHLNLAARLMQSADDGAVLCDAATYQAAGETRGFERLPPYVLKGLGTPTDVYRIRSGTTTPEKQSDLIDRTDELGRADAVLGELASGSGGVVFIEGDPGIGKSRVAAEWADRAAQRGIRASTGRASDIEDATPFHAWRAVLDDLLGMTAVTDRHIRGSMVAQRLDAAGMHVELIPLLGSFLSLDFADNALTAQLSGEVRADNTLDLLVDLLRSASAAGPVMIVLEDVQWLDSASWQLILRTRSELPGMLFVLTTRPVAESASETAAAVKRDSMLLRLPAFSRQHSLALAAQRSGATELDSAVATLVHERAEGNPLFIEQLTYAMRDSGQVVIDHGVLRPASDGADLAAATVPDSIQRVITTRLDQLAPAHAMTLKVASVIGQRFAIRTLTDIHPLSSDQDELLGDLNTLSRLGLVAPTPAAEPSFEFSHKITQEVAYNLMPSAQSRQLHRKVAEWYETAYADDLSPFHAFLAYHWRNADVPDRAMDYLELAGIGALRTFANEEAIEFLSEARELDAKLQVGSDPLRHARWLLALGEAYVNLSRYREGRENLEQGLRLLRRSPPGRRSRRALSLVGQVSRQGAHRLRLRTVRRLSDDERAELVAVSRAYERLAEAAYYDGDTTLALYSSIRILNEAEASGSAPEIARGLAGTGALFGLAPMPRVAESYLRRAEAQLEKVDDATTHEIVRLVIGFYLVGAGKWLQAREQFNTVRSTARRLGDRRRLMDAVGNLLEIEYLQGSVADALELSDELIAMARARSDHRFEADALVGRAYALLELDRSTEAVRALDDVRDIVLHAPDLPTELRIKTQGLLALASLSRGDRVAANVAAEEALRLTRGLRPAFFTTFFGYVAPVEVYLAAFESGGSQDSRSRLDDAMNRLKRYADVFPIGRPRYRVLAGTRAWLLGDRVQAKAHWDRAIREASALSMVYERGLAEYEIGRHLDPSDPERSRHLNAARDAFTQLGATRLLSLVSTVLIATAGG